MTDLSKLSIKKTKDAFETYTSICRRAPVFDSVEERSDLPKQVILFYIRSWCFPPWRHSHLSKVIYNQPYWLFVNKSVFLRKPQPLPKPNQTVYRFLYYYILILFYIIIYYYIIYYIIFILLLLYIFRMQQKSNHINPAYYNKCW